MDYYRLRGARLYHRIVDTLADYTITSMQSVMFFFLIPTIIFTGLGLIVWQLTLPLLLLVLIVTAIPAGIVTVYLVKYSPPDFADLDAEIWRLQQRRAAIRANPRLAKVPTSLIDTLYNID